MFETTRRVQTLRHYADAQYAYNNIKPVRGSNVRPLGARRDKQYQVVRLGADTEPYSYAARLWETNVITFHPDNTIVIEHGGWATALTMAFVQSVLGIKAYRTRGACVYEVNGIKYSIKGKGSKLVLQAEEGRLCPSYNVKQAQTHKQWAVNRTAANNVRGRVKGFRDYLRGFISLREEIVPIRWRGDMAMIKVGVDELCDQLGIHQSPNGATFITTDPFYRIDQKGTDRHLQKLDAFYNLIRNDQPEETRLANYYKAALGLLTGSRPMIPIDGITTDVFEFESQGLIAYFDEVLFKYFSDEVFVLKDVPEGQVPSNKYDTWVNMPKSLGND